MMDLFHDRDAAAAMEAGGTLFLGSGRQLRLPAVLGFCRGVVRALRLLEGALGAAAGRPVWLLGEIIHNRTVNEAYRQAGVQMLAEDALEEVFRVAHPGDVFVMPAFGLPVELEQRLREFARPGGGLILDTTCPYVKRIWQFVGRAAASGQTVIIHGKPGHPETRATLSRSLGRGNAVVLIPTPAAAAAAAAAVRSGSWSGYPAQWMKQPEHLDVHSLALVNQTTMLYSETIAISRQLDAAVRHVGGRITIAETVCRATQDRQDAATELCAAGCDLILVLGGVTSSNTNQLYRMAAHHAPTYFIESAAAIGAASIRHYLPDAGRETETRDWLRETDRRIGLLAGASCPAPDIGAVIRCLRRLCGGG